MILTPDRHSCPKTHPYQDDLYNGGRVANYAVKQSSEAAPHYRCTVCGAAVRA